MGILGDIFFYFFFGNVPLAVLQSFQGNKTYK